MIPPDCGGFPRRELLEHGRVDRKCKVEGRKTKGKGNGTIY